MWASRLEFNLVSRSSRAPRPERCRSGRAPREALAALALADLATRSGAAKAVANLDAAWAALAGVARTFDRGSSPSSAAGRFDHRSRRVSTS